MCKSAKIRQVNFALIDTLFNICNAIHHFKESCNCIIIENKTNELLTLCNYIIIKSFLIVCKVFLRKDSEKIRQ